MKVKELPGLKFYDKCVIRYVNDDNEIVNTDHKNGLFCVSTTADWSNDKSVILTSIRITFDGDVVKGFYDKPGQTEKLKVIDYEVSDEVLYIKIPETWGIY